MKNVLLYLLIAVSSLSVNAQNVGIGTNSPDPSAILDLNSTSRGFLAPRMTAAQRTSIASPVAGLMVYETTSSSYWIFNGTVWVQLASGGSSPWASLSNNIYNTNSGNVGIGISTPASKLHLVGNMLMNSTNPIIQFQQNGTDIGFVQLSGNNLRLGTNSSNGAGKIVFRAFGNDHIFIDSIGQLGIGKSSPQFDLDVYGNARIQSLSAFKRSTLSIYANPFFQNDPYGPGGFTFFNWVSLGGNNYDYIAKFRIEMDGGAAERLKLYHIDHDNQLVLLKNGNVGIGKLPSEKFDVQGNAQLEDVSPLFKIKSTAQIIPLMNMGIEFNSTTETKAKILYTDEALKITEGPGSNDLVLKGGRIGVGTGTPEEALHLIGNMQMNNFNPFLKFQNSGVDKGFVDVSTNDLRIGTFNTNTSGNFKVRVNGGDRMIVDPDGSVQLTGGVDASMTSKGYLMIGSQSGTNMVMDNNEIIVRGAGGVTSTLILQNDGGSVRIGNDAVPAGYKFAVNGKVICEELKVKLASTGWPDYVFDKQYRLPSLQELEIFINQNKHLPNIPSATEVEKNGIEVGDMQKRMMEKIEELTLYILQLEKNNQALQQRVSKLEKGASN